MTGAGGRIVGVPPGTVPVHPVGALPTLDALAADPARVAALPPEAMPLLLARLAALQSALTARLVAAGQNGHSVTGAPAEDRLLDVAEAAKLLCVSEDWLYRRAARLPFAVRLGRHLRFSVAGIERYLRQRQGRA